MGKRAQRLVNRRFGSSRRIAMHAAVCGSVLGLSALLVPDAARPAPDPVPERQALMKQLGQQMKAAGNLANGQTLWDAAQAKAVADAVARSGQTSRGLFPSASASHPKTNAAAAVWQNRSDFDKRLAQMSTLARTMGKADTQAAFRASFQDLSATCKSCHDVYRKKKS